MAKDENRRFWHSGVNGLFESHINLDDNSSPFQYGYMHNGYYRVFTALTQPQTYTIKSTLGIQMNKTRKIYGNIGVLDSLFFYY